MKNLWCVGLYVYCLYLFKFHKCKSFGVTEMILGQFVQLCNSCASCFCIKTIFFVCLNKFTSAVVGQRKLFWSPLYHLPIMPTNCATLYYQNSARQSAKCANVEKRWIRHICVCWITSRELMYKTACTQCRRKPTSEALVAINRLTNSLLISSHFDYPASRKQRTIKIP